MFFNKFGIFRQIFENKYRIIKFSEKWGPSCEMRTDRQTMTKLIIPPPNFANAPENGLLFHLLPYPERRTDPHRLVRWSMSEKCLRRLRNGERVKVNLPLMKVFREPGY